MAENHGTPEEKLSETLFRFVTECDGKVISFVSFTANDASG